MGVEQTVLFPAGHVPDWEPARLLLEQHGFPVQLRMIDGQLSFPDETPPADWRELRLGTPQGMVTVRREPGRAVFVTWGNADTALVQAWHAATWAFAEAGGGRVQAPTGSVSAAEFRRSADLPAVLREVV